MNRYAGIYANGMHEPVIIELRLLGYIVEEHYPDHHVVIFKSRNSEEESDINPLCFLYHFQLIGSYGVKGQHFPPIIEISSTSEKSHRKRTNNFKKKHRIRDEYAIADATTILQKHIEDSCEEYFKHLNKPWKIVCERQGDHAFSGEDICRLFGEVAKDKFKEAREKGMQIENVSLKHHKVEIFIFISNANNGNTETDQKTDQEWQNDDSQQIDLWFFGIRNKVGNFKLLEEKCDLSKQLSKGCENFTSESKESVNYKNDPPSTTNNSIAACLIILAVEKYFLKNKSILFLDPMCGVGTIPFVFEQLASKLGWKPILFGSEVDTSSVKLFNRKKSELMKHREKAPHNVHQNELCSFSYLNIVMANTLNLPFGSDTFNLIIVDPPWGHRHGKNHVIMKNMFRWMKEWVRVLKHGGILGIMTIRTKQVLHEYNSHFSDGRGLELLERVYFENSGMSQCCYFIFRKIIT